MFVVDHIQDWHQIAIELMMTDLDLALQAITSLFAEDSKEVVARVVRNSRTVYDSLLARHGEVLLPPDELALFNDKMNRLRDRLRFMGEAV
jgi:hypothetical protein